MTARVEGASVSFRHDVKQSDLFAAQQQILREYIPALDGLRALAIITVVWHNVTAGRYTGGAALKIINMLSNSGWVGVQLFFVLSGFLITGILLDENRSTSQLRNFYMRRFLRIFPLYYAVLCTVFFILPMLDALPAWLHGDHRQQIWYWAFLTNWTVPFLGGYSNLGHFWSLAVEEQFYLLWPLLVIRLKRHSLILVCIFLLISALLARGVFIFYDLHFALEAAYKFTVARWDALAVGALLALLMRDYDRYKWVIRFSPFVLGAASMYIVLFMVLNRNFAPVGPGMAAVNQTAAALLFAALLFSTVKVAPGHSSRGQRCLACSPLRSVGKYSYAIYVFHLPMAQILNWFWKSYFEQKPPLFGVTGFAVLVFVASYLAACCSWYLLERPCLRLKRFFSSK